MKRTQTSKAWMHEHVNDPYVLRARREGYRSRAAYKLLELDERDSLLKPGMTVVDLGATPGGWSQVASQKIGASGRLIALDILDMQPLHNVSFIRGDFREEAVLGELVNALAGRRIDLVISDMAPNISGINLSDQARAMHLAELALEFALDHLRSGGAFVVKVFQGEGLDDFVQQMRCDFQRVLSRKPLASRGRSNEIYLIGKDKR